MLSRPEPGTNSNGHKTSPRLIHTTCENQQKGQFWMFKNGTHICFSTEDNCLAVTSAGFLYLDLYNQTSPFQQWVFDDEKNQLVNVNSDLCLSDGSTDNLTNDAEISLVKVVGCDKLDKGQEWSFEPLSVDNTSFKNAKNSPSQEKKNGKKIRLQK